MNSKSKTTTPVKISILDNAAPTSAPTHDKAVRRKVFPVPGHTALHCVLQAATKMNPTPTDIRTMFTFVNKYHVSIGALLTLVGQEAQQRNRFGLVRRHLARQGEKLPSAPKGPTLRDAEDIRAWCVLQAVEIPKVDPKVLKRPIVYGLHAARVAQHKKSVRRPQPDKATQRPADSQGLSGAEINGRSTEDILAELALLDAGGTEDKRAAPMQDLPAESLEPQGSTVCVSLECAGLPRVRLEVSSRKEVQSLKDFLDVYFRAWF